MPQDYVASFSEAKGTDVLHFGVPGMKWGVRNNRSTSSTNSSRASKVIVKSGGEQKRQIFRTTMQTTGYSAPTHRTSMSALQTSIRNKGPLQPNENRVVTHHDTRSNNLHVWNAHHKQGHTTMEHIASFEQVTPTGRVQKVLKVKSGKEPVVEQLLLKFRRERLLAKSVTTQTLKSSKSQKTAAVVKRTSNYALLPVSDFTARAKTIKAVFRHEAGVEITDYVGAYISADGDVKHFGVPGMKWGVRRSQSSGGSATPTRARRKEVEATSKAKEANKLVERAEKIKGGTGRPLVLNGKVLSREQSVKHLERQAEKLGVKPKPKTKSKTDDDPDSPPSDATKYAQLKAKAKEKGPSSLTDEELKFVNSRAEALNKTQKLVADPDSWLAKTIKSTVQNVIQENLKTVLNDAAKEFVVNRANASFKAKAAQQSTARTNKRFFSVKPTLGSGSSGPRASKRSGPKPSSPSGPKVVYKVTTL